MSKTDISSVRRQYDRHMRAKAAILAACGVMVFVTAVFSICVGAADLSLSLIHISFIFHTPVLVSIENGFEIRKSLNVLTQTSLLS